MHVDYPYLLYGYEGKPMPAEHLEMQLILMVDAFTSENGGTRVWEGSQLRRENPYVSQHESIALFEEHFRAIEGDAGTLVIATGLIWHQSGKNVTPHGRLGLLGQYVRGDVCEHSSRTYDDEVLARCPYPSKVQW